MKPIVCLLVALLLVASSPSRARADSLSAVAWLAGCWTHSDREAGSAEHWMAPAGGVMLGMGRVLKNGRVVEFEFMQIRADADGRMSFVAQPQGGPATEFKLLRQDDAETVFENPAHDFPQRVRYRREGADQLVARIEGSLKGQARSIDFPMQRSACP